ncbi:MAG: formylglycine-generating enzyme family protein [Alphaproteobacteria bacterium]|nr:formylglycine-generating enzyme family protein [Alphaproteobacteria bacterium]
MKCKTFLSALVALLLPAAAQAADISWNERLYNPTAQPGDLILPMPCGGAMTFRPVPVPAEKLLGDRKLVLGGTDERFAYAESSRSDHIAGSFSPAKGAGKEGGRLYYLGKYEVTDDQFAALSGKCGRASNIGRLPKTSVTWLEAMDFATSYTEWLYTNAAGKVPAEDGARGFLRLPTETEWEYAARGGAAVSESEFVAPVFPMAEPLSAYAWYGAPDSSDFKRQAVGLLKPNPLGLHDILGNAGELALEPYRLNKVSRLHGQSGGAVVRGGDFFTPQDAIRTAQRQEMTPFDAKGQRRLETVGFRLALSAPVVTSPERLAAIEAEWDKLPAVESALAGTARQEDPLQELALLIDAAPDPAFQERLKELRTVMRANIVTRNEQRDRAVRNLLRFGAILAQRILDADGIRSGREKALAALKPAYPADSPVLANLARDVEAAAGDVETNIRHYRDTIVELIRDYPDSVIQSQGKVLDEELAARSLTALQPLARVFRQHVGVFRETRNLPSGDIIKSLR